MYIKLKKSKTEFRTQDKYRKQWCCVHLISCILYIIFTLLYLLCTHIFMNKCLDYIHVSSYYA